MPFVVNTFFSAVHRRCFFFVKSTVLLCDLISRYTPKFFCVETGVSGKVFSGYDLAHV